MVFATFLLPVTARADVQTVPLSVKMSDGHDVSVSWLEGEYDYRTGSISEYLASQNMQNKFEVGSKVKIVFDRQGGNGSTVLVDTDNAQPGDFSVAIDQNLMGEYYFTDCFISAMPSSSDGSQTSFVCKDTNGNGAIDSLELTILRITPERVGNLQNLFVGKIDDWGNQYEVPVEIDDPNPDKPSFLIYNCTYTSDDGVAGVAGGGDGYVTLQIEPNRNVEVTKGIFHLTRNALGLVTDINVELVYADSGKPAEKVEVPEVQGTTGVTASGYFNGKNVPKGSKVELKATKLEEGSGDHDKLLNSVGSTEIGGFYSVDLLVDGKSVHDDFGTISVSFPIDPKYNGRTVTVYHLHNDGSITGAEGIRVVDGKVTITISDLSSFAVALEPETTTGEQTKPEDKPTEKPGTKPSEEKPADSKPSDEEPKADDRAELPKTGDISSVVPAGFALIGAAFASAGVVSKRKR